ncbi:Phage related protein [Liberibacter crescens BT-1]|uniref:Phage related protein n=1 Tax=Liberibacter crescens (strain BT-1) TaxID=1215343 RepID=L0EU27_LIBCB|nr:ERF family protein [Liberibacter crescens]AGA64462.1 Phage related protein [Liberibacter crescens BT-1]
MNNIVEHNTETMEIMPAGTSAIRTTEEHEITRELTPVELLQMAIRDRVNVEIIERLMELNKRWEDNKACKAFYEAISDARAEIPVIFKNNQGHNYKYEDIASIAATIDPILARHGLCYRFHTESTKELVTVTCIISHKDGHRERNSLSAPPDEAMGNRKNYNHSIGSTVTYLSRYTLRAALGLAASADDDGTYARYNNGQASAIANDNAPVNPQQLLQIKKLMAEASVSEERICSICKVDNIENIPSRFFNSVIAKLNQSLRLQMEQQQKEAAHV